MIGLETVTYNERKPNQREIEMDNYLNENNMSKEMNWDTFVPTREIREYDRKSRESIRQREQLKLELAELEKKPRDIFWDVEYAMFYNEKESVIIGSKLQKRRFMSWRY